MVERFERYFSNVKGLSLPELRHWLLDGIGISGKGY
jgi:hypothetical protein